MQEPIELIHRPLGDRHPFEQGADERVPRHPYPQETVELRALTRPIGAVKTVSVSFWEANQPEQIERGAFTWLESIQEAEFSADGHLSEAAARAGLVLGVDRWRASLPAFPAGARVRYRLSIENDAVALDSHVYAYTVRTVVTLDVVAGIFQGPGGVLFALQDSTAEQRGYLCLTLMTPEHLRFSVGSGEWQGRQDFKALTLPAGGDGRITLELGDVQVVADMRRFELQLAYQGQLILPGMIAPQVVYGPNEVAEVVQLTFASPGEEGFYGFGERFNALNQRGQKLDIRVYEQYKNQGLRTYLPVPMFVSSQGYGLLVHSSRYSEFDLAHTITDQWSLKAELGAQANVELDFLAGKRSNLLDIVARLNALTGRPVLPPHWAFGLWMSSNEWNTQARVEEVVRLHAEYGIPVTVLVLEAWSDENTFYIWNGARYVPRPGGERFQYADFEFPADGMWPDPQGMLTDLHARGLRLLLWQIPAMPPNKSDHPQLANDMRYALENGYCVLREDGSPYHIRPFWFHGGLLPDFTHPDASEWWLEKRRYLLEELGIDGFKTDGGEHIWGRDLVFADGRGSDEVWNEYPNLYAGAYFEYARRYRPEAITFSRAGYAGAQAYPCHWAGDENSTWEALRHSILAGLNAGISGVPFWGWDIAGFSGEIPTAELYLRATAMATFCPIMQYHSEYNFHRQPCNDRTPWNIAEWTGMPKVLSIFRYFANLRMNLLPYTLASARQSAVTGLPLMRALCVAYPQDEKAAAFPYEYLFGDSLLVAPIVEPGLEIVEVYLPEGDWYSLWDGAPYAGGTVHSLLASLDQIPVFVRAGSLLPMNLGASYKLGSEVGNRTDAFEHLCFLFYPGPAGGFTWQAAAEDVKIGFAWHEITPGRFVLNIDAVAIPLHILLPPGFAFDPSGDELATGAQIRSLADTGAQDLQIYVTRKP